MEKQKVDEGTHAPPIPKVDESTKLFGIGDDEEGDDDIVVETISNAEGV